ncbi:MAG: amidohydrolase family protein [Phycisphaerae bacterium]
MIIDMHVHHRLGPEARTDFAALERLKRLAAAVGITRLCLLGNVFRYGIRANREQIQRINDSTIEMVRGSPDCVSGFAFINPALSAADVRQEIRRCSREGLSGIKLEIDLNARDRRMRHVMATAADLGLPVLHHAWYKTQEKYPHESSPADVANLARRFPACTIIMAHVVAAGVRGVLDVADCPNVLVDTSGSQPVAGMIEYALAVLGAERLVFGSDVPGRDFACQLGKVLGARMSQSDRRRILCLNARRLLKLQGRAA